MKRLIGVLLVLVFGVSLFGATYTMRGETSAKADNISNGWVIDENTKSYEVADYNLSDYVTLGDIDNISLDVPYEEVTDDSIIAQINDLLLDYPGHSVVNKETAELNDIVNISYVGTIDGEEFEGGSDDNGYVTLGSASMIPGFEEGILGMTLGETRVLNLTFPDNYYPEYAGKDVEFTVTLKAIVEEVQLTYETIDDAFVRDTFGLDGVEALFNYLKEYAISNLESEKENKALELLMEKMLEISEVEVPKELVEYKTLSYLAKLKAGINKAGMSVDVYLQNYYNQTEEEFYESVKGMIYESVEKQMLLAYYAEVNGIELDEEVYNSYKSSFIQYYGYNSEEELYKDYPEAELRISCLSNQVIEHLLSVIKINYIPM